MSPRASTVAVCWPITAPSPVLNVVSVNEPSSSSWPLADCVAILSPPACLSGTGPGWTCLPLYVTLPVTLAVFGMLGSPPQPRASRATPAEAARRVRTDFDLVGLGMRRTPIAVGWMEEGRILGRH